MYIAAECACALCFLCYGLTLWRHCLSCGCQEKGTEVRHVLCCSLILNQVCSCESSKFATNIPRPKEGSVVNTSFDRLLPLCPKSSKMVDLAPWAI